MFKLFELSNSVNEVQLKEKMFERQRKCMIGMTYAKALCVDGVDGGRKGREVAANHRLFGRKAQLQKVRKVQ